MCACVISLNHRYLLELLSRFFIWVACLAISVATVSLFRGLHSKLVIEKCCGQKLNTEKPPKEKLTDADYELTEEQRQKKLLEKMKEQKEVATRRNTILQWQFVHDHLVADAFANGVGCVCRPRIFVCVHVHVCAGD